LKHNVARAWCLAASVAAAATLLLPADGVAQSRRERTGSSWRGRGDAAASTQPTTRTTSTQALSRPTNFADGYRVLLDRNIFSRSRTAPSRTGGPATTAPVTQPRGGLVLTGVVREANEYVVFIEDTRVNTTTRYHVGDTVGDGKITAAGLDHIEVTTAGRPVTVELGSMVQGTAGAIGYGSPGADGSTGTTSAPGTPSGGGAGDILERLRQRRLQETKR
jgi:hypothetical protein